MQAVLHVSPLPLSLARSAKISTPLPLKSVQKLTRTIRCPPIRSSAPTTTDNSTVDYGSMNSSVFPAEACETLGGEVCDVEMFPEVKLKPEAKSSAAGTSTEQVDREYLEYDSPKTVFLEEACDDLGGEFCEPDFQRS